MLATLGIRDAFEVAQPDLGVAAVMSALPLMIPLVIILMRKLRTTRGAAVSVAVADVIGRAPPSRRCRRRADDRRGASPVEGGRRWRSPSCC